MNWFSMLDAHSKLQGSYLKTLMPAPLPRPMKLDFGSRAQGFVFGRALKPEHPLK